MSISHDAEISRLLTDYRHGNKPTDTIEAAFDAIEATDDPGIFISLVDRDDALAQARELGGRIDPTKPLYGVPFAVKDNIDVAGLPTTAACPDYAYTPTASAPAVDRLVEAGAILIGKTNLDQFATGLVGTRTPYPVPRNALDPSLVPGGSSSGSAVAVARGLVSFALGTDTAGSGRVPAALNNIVGLKPSCGALSTRGVVPACRSLDCISIFAGTVADAWSAFSVAAGYDKDDPWSRPLPLGRPTLPPSVRIGVPDDKSRVFGSDTAAAAFDAALDLLPDIGPSHRPVDLTPFFATAALLYEGAWVAERYQAIRDFIEGRPDALHPVTRQIIEGATSLSAADAFAGIYRLAELKRATAGIWNDIDVLVVPSIPDVCTLADIEAHPIGANARLGTYTNFVNLLDLCALAVPGPFRGDGLPSGVTLIAPAGRDGLLAAVGAALHGAAGVRIGANGFKIPAVAAQPAEAPPASVEVAVVGAHLSGMALNHQLTSRGGVFVRKAETEPTYRLFALPGGPPPRPGLMRTNQIGNAIETEVWALSREAFGDFVTTIPSPLGIGTLNLGDGTTVKGFLCEAAAIDGARDISSFGGWRAYIASLG
ncbi:MAG: allophanate hydrolase [Bauldia litoralis]|uniref:allophanate hydrolase n=1 Tax=Bauldia litoralis TaxID=665467 RepID=UPI003298C132